MTEIPSQFQPTVGENEYRTETKVSLHWTNWLAKWIRIIRHNCTTKQNAIIQGRISSKYFCFAPHKKPQPNSLSMIVRAQDLFLSYTACGSPCFGNRASQIVHQMKTECAVSSPTQEPTSSAKELLTPTVIVLQEVSSPVRMPHPGGDAPSPLTCLSLLLACQRLRFWVCPWLHLVVSAWSKSAMSTQGARGKEIIRVTAFRVG